MRLREKSLPWRFGYGCCCLVYLVWVVQLSHNNFEMVQCDYRRAEAGLQPMRIKALALKELVAKCRKESKRIEPLRQSRDQAVAADPCLIWPEAVLDRQQEVVVKRLVDVRHGAISKLVVFYVGFGVIFLILPPVILYLLLSFFVWLFRGLKVVR